jgi:hypothetical protein
MNQYNIYFIPLNIELIKSPNLNKQFHENGKLKGNLKYQIKVNLNHYSQKLNQMNILTILYHVKFSPYTRTK